MNLLDEIIFPRKIPVTPDEIFVHVFSGNMYKNSWQVMVVVVLVMTMTTMTMVVVVVMVVVLLLMRMRMNKYYIKQLISMVIICPSREAIGPLYSDEGANWPHF